MAQHGKKYSGDLYGRPYGTTDGFTKMGNVSELSTKKDVEKDDLLSTGREDFGEALSTDVKTGATEVTIKFNSFDKDGMARALMGTAIDLDTVPKDITAAELTVGLGWIKLEHKDIDPTTLVLTDASVPVEADTYELNPRLGMIQFNEKSTLVVDKKITYTAKTLGSAGYQIAANTLASLPMEMYLDGEDRITGDDGILEIPHAVMSSDGDINWMSDDWWESGFTGKLIKDAGKPTMLFTEYRAK